MMHFGNIVKKSAENNNITVEDMAWLMDRSADEVVSLYHTEEWTSGNIKAASEALNQDFGSYLNRTIEYDFVKKNKLENYHEMLINIKYPVGKENLFEAWLERTWLMAQSIGLEVEG
ncbi:hypothetical protein KXQ82_17525 [Mucilaginibacter sp. HMF5004]|uniref:hypothetical protein n=1 Tax=Mucilaginibacter rivuli TaxID=2857527 RepID=UPI001C5E7B66|nr:hypothetical protein [Mucilaginibacter rivuli]MBW4891532.1 hypothetical protein [Mucilaginibacter rivuli]